MEYLIKNPTVSVLTFLMEEANCDVDGYEEDHYIISGDTEEIEVIIKHLKNY